MGFVEEYKIVEDGFFTPLKIVYMCALVVALIALFWVLRALISPKKYD